MHTFMTAILFRVSRVRVDRFDVELNEPNGERRESRLGTETIKVFVAGYS